jgi:S1-C subfamily serine protease
VLGALFLTAFACFLIAFLSAGILWVLTDISQQLELSRKPLAQAQTNMPQKSKANPTPFPGHSVGPHGSPAPKVRWHRTPCPSCRISALTGQRTASGHVVVSVPRQQTMKWIGTLLLMLSLSATVAMAGEINACKYLILTDFTSDPYGIARELRTQASAKGFVVVSAVSEVPKADLLKTCVMTGSWGRDFGGGELSVKVVDAPSGALVGEAGSSGSRIGAVARTVRYLVSKVYSQLGYTGYNEDVNRARILREYPARPTLAVTEEEIKKTEAHSPVEGIWSDTQDQYRLGIVPASKGSGADYVAVILRSNSALWQPGEIKAEIRSTASPDIFTCTFFMADKKPAGTTLTLEHDAMLRGSVATPKGPQDLLFVRVWPNVSTESVTTSSTTSVSSGTGFPLSLGGLVATNWHVVADAKNFSVAFPGWSGAISAEIAVKDVINDLAILRMSDASKLATTCPELPFQLFSSSGVTLGEHVSAIGYPLTPMLGSNPKFTEGAISSKSGWQDDPRSLQISAQVQPGSSGSPLFDGDGNIIGIVVATLDASKVYQAASAIPQNVNFAIKADYLLSLAAMLPGSVGSRTTVFSPEKAAQCVAIIRAW